MSCLWGYRGRAEGLTLIEGERDPTSVLSDSCAILCPLNSTFSCRHYPLMPVNREIIANVVYDGLGSVLLNSNAIFELHPADDRRHLLGTV